MGKKDIAQKCLEDYNDVFSDIVNALLFEGRQVMLSEDLIDVNPRSNYNVSGKIRDQERDVSKQWKKCGAQISVAMLGIENQISEDKYMPVRIMGYDGASYRNQLLRNKKEVPVPVTSLVLHFGYEHRWNTPKTLLECMNVPDEVRAYVSDYSINVFDIAFLTDEELGRFKSDFRFVADYFVQMQRTGDYVPPVGAIEHLQELMQLMTALSGAYSFEDVYNEFRYRERKERIDMRDVLQEKFDAKMQEGREVGEKIGREIGEKNRARKSAIEMIHDNMPMDKIIRYTGLTESEIIQIKEEESVPV